MCIVYTQEETTDNSLLPTCKYCRCFLLIRGQWVQIIWKSKKNSPNNKKKKNWEHFCVNKQNYFEIVSFFLYSVVVYLYNSSVLTLWRYCLFMPCTLCVGIEIYRDVVNPLKFRLFSNRQRAVVGWPNRFYVGKYKIRSSSVSQGIILVAFLEVRNNFSSQLELYKCNKVHWST